MPTGVWKVCSGSATTITTSTDANLLPHGLCMSCRLVPGSEDFRLERHVPGVQKPQDSVEWLLE